MIATVYYEKDEFQKQTSTLWPENSVQVYLPGAPMLNRDLENRGPNV
jgi:hypothetical protein